MEEPEMNKYISELCKHVTGLDDDSVILYYQFALVSLGESSFATSYKSEFTVEEEVKKALSRSNKAGDVLRFTDVYRKLMSVNDSLKRKHVMVALLLELSDLGPKKKPKDVDSVVLPFRPLEFSVHPKETVCGSGNPPSTFPSSDRSPSAGSVSKVFKVPNHERKSPSAESRSRKFKPLVFDKKHKSRTPTSPSKGLTEETMVNELLYAFQGIDSKLLKFDVQTQQFEVDPKAGLSTSERKYVLILSELGCYYLRLKKFIETFKEGDGAMQLALKVALEEQIDEYNRMVTVWESQTKSGHGPMTLACLDVVSKKARRRLQFLMSLTEQIRNLKGGALATELYNYSFVCNPAMQVIVEHLLSKVCTPLYSMILEWVFEGELQDRTNEFFVSCVSIVGEDSWWEHKYELRSSMVPCFMCSAHAKKILATGKSINFLRQFCEDQNQFYNKESLKKNLQTTPVKCLFMDNEARSFSSMIDNAYSRTSGYLLNVLTTRYKLPQHLAAVRRFLLLGQGDFIRHLLELLESELNRSGSTIYPYTLLGLLEAAIRSTSAQYEDPEILKRLDVELLEASIGDTGWDLFSLNYHVDGPISTVFTPQCINRYLTLFNTLWRAKRMEYMLAGIFKRYMTASKALRRIPETFGVLHQTHLLGAEMLQFCNQMAYYLTFEVVECCWANLEKSVAQAHALDDIINSQKQFLNTVFTGMLLHEHQQTLRAQLRAIYDLFGKYADMIEKLVNRCDNELDARENYKKMIDTRTAQNQYGVTAAEEEAEAKRKKDFTRIFLPEMTTELKILTHSYQSTVGGFLAQLANTPDEGLRWLSFRLDFNEYYKRKDSRLKVPHTYEHRRLSSVMSLSLTDSFMDRSLGL